jgi:hypothetical protein
VYNNTTAANAADIPAMYGMNLETLLNRVNAIDVEKEEKMQIVNHLRNGWKKFSEEEKEAFRKLQ